MLCYLLLLVSHQRHHHVLFSVLGSNFRFLTFIHHITCSAQHVLTCTPVVARIFDGYSSCSVKALVNISKSDHLITRPCCCITDGKHCSEGLETCCKNSAASPVCYPGENRQAGWMDGWIRTMVGLGLGEWVGPTWVGGTMATVFKKKVKEQTWQFWIIKKLFQGRQLSTSSYEFIKTDLAGTENRWNTLNLEMTKLPVRVRIHPPIRAWLWMLGDNFESKLDKNELSPIPSKFKRNRIYVCM